MTTDREGGCFCGAVRYRVEGEPREAGYCHCRMCQRSVGAPAVAWGTWEAGQFRWLNGEPRTLQSSAEGQRRFCGDCGTQLLFWAANDPDVVDVNLVTLDQPEAVEPRHHGWTDSKIAWFDTTDTHPRFSDGAIQERQRLREQTGA